MKRVLTLAFMAALISACGGSDSKNKNDGLAVPKTSEIEAPGVEAPEVETYSPESKHISSIKLLDSLSRPLANASVLLNRTVAASGFTAQAVASVFVTDADGNLIVDDLTPGKYQLSVTIGDITVTMVLAVAENNAVDGMTAVLPIKVSTDGSGFVTAVDLTGNGLVLGITGVIYDESGPVEGAQVSVSGGVGTNGAIATAVSDIDGVYVLTLNVGSDRSEALESGNIRIAAGGYETRVISASSEVDVTQSGAAAGLNFMLLPSNENVAVYYSESFEQTSENAVCGTWMEEFVARIPINDNCDDCNFSEELVAASAVFEEILASPLLLWNSHSSNELIYNQAYLDGLVVLAPNDISEGLVVSPTSNAACWYGNDITGTQSTGNFIGEPDAELSEDYVLNGGESMNANGAAIVSPHIDLTGLEAPVALSFDTWWEIESVNPNELGFDIMAVEYSIDNGDSWNTLARLNPYTDPITGDENWLSETSVEANNHPRAPIPYSNTGFNSAPQWLKQEPISLDALIGNIVQLRFAFRTQDELYNGFRGWMVDNVEVSALIGTFPLFDDTGGDPLDGVIDEDPPQETDLLMTVDIFPEGAGLNAGSEYTFEAVVDWVGGDIETLTFELVLDDEIILFEQVNNSAFNFYEGGYYYDLSGQYSSSSEGAFTVKLTAKDSSGEVVFTKEVEYQLYPV